ncbi:hypothetical protein [Enemella dayhoffiae]|uniref:hypothetical protein n=1 Tax=Enemella dayhoffiae TaxID=2016507 RepID=UPI001595437A|nr:hypothetical protein [Enemella dayhoffiae]
MARTLKRAFAALLIVLTLLAASACGSGKSNNTGAGPGKKIVVATSNDAPFS